MKEKELKIYKMHDIYWGRQKYTKGCEMYWDVQWIPIPKRFRCKFSADNKKEV